MPIFEDHDCLLLMREEDIVNQVIDTGCCIFIRRKIRRMCMISQNHPTAKLCVKSYAACRTEEIKHLVYYFYKIHPFSVFNLYWNFFMFIIYSLEYTLIPIDSVFLIDQYKYGVDHVLLFADMIRLIDIIIIFMTAFFDYDRSKVVFQSSTIAMRYLKSYFFIDVTSSLYNYLWLVRKRIPVNVLVGIRLFNRLKILRLRRCVETWDLFCQYMGYSGYFFKAVEMLMIFLVIVMWCFSITFFVRNYITYREREKLSFEEEIDVWSRQIREVYESYMLATMMIMLAGYGEEKLQHGIEYATAIFFLCFGFAVQLFVYAQLLQVWTKYVSSEYKHYFLYEQFREHMKYKELPINLQQRVISYFNYKYHRQYYKDSDIYNVISPILKQEILLYVTRSHLENVSFLKHVPDEIIIDIVKHLRSEVYLIGDEIMSVGSYGNAMYFIRYGTVAVYNQMGKEVFHLEDGDHFGEVALIFNEIRVATVVALTNCEILILKRTDFLQAIEPFPEFRDWIVGAATTRLSMME